MDGAAPAAAPAAPSTNLNGTSAPPPFLSKTYEMVDDPSTDAIVSWGPNNNSFVVWNTPEFARDLLPKYFKHNNFSSFVRQLNTYGFRKVDPDRWEFANEGFLRGQKHLLKNISRRKPSQVQSQQPHPPPPQPPTAVPACVEVGKFGLEEEIEQLKRDKNVLMQELIRLRQQQQTTDHQLHTLGERLHGMEQRQQQMMAFLAKAMQSPGFLAQLVQQNDTANKRRITAAAGNKKRRYPNQAGTELDGGESSLSSSLDGQIVKYQPLINEAAKAMVMQILKLETLSGGGSDSFLVNNFSSALGSRDNNVGSAIRNLGVTLKEVPTTSGIPFLPSSSGFSSSSTSSPNMVNEPIIAPELSAIQGGAMSNGDSSSILSESFAVNEVDTGFVESIPPVVEGQNPLDLDSLGEDMDFLDEVENLPSIQDPFWEQFLTASPSPSPSPVDAGDNSNVQENSDMMPELENGWDKLQNMENLTEQMGHLTSEAKK